MPLMLFWTHWSPTSTPAEPRTPLEALSTPWWSGIQMRPSGVPAAAPPPRPWPLLNLPCLHADQMRLSGPLLWDRSGLHPWLDKARGRSAPAALAPLVSAALASHLPTRCFQSLPPHHRPPLPHLQTNKVTCSPHQCHRNKVLTTNLLQCRELVSSMLMDKVRVLYSIMT